MSRLNFTDQAGSVELMGAECASLRSVALDIGLQAWGLNAPYAGSWANANLIMGMARDDNPTTHGSIFDEWRKAQGGDVQLKADLIASLKVHLRLDGLRIAVAGHSLNTNDLTLNTALACGSNQVRLAAKLAGWSYCWLEGLHRGWLAGIIDHGLESGVFRSGLFWVDRALNIGERVEDAPDRIWSDLGWAGVAEFLRAGGGPVVISSDGFPSVDVSAWEPTVDPAWVPDWAIDDEGRAEWDALGSVGQFEQRIGHANEQWYELPADVRWRHGMDGLRAQRPWAQLAPTTLGVHYFGKPVTIFHVMSPKRDELVEAVVGGDHGAES